MIDRESITIYGREWRPDPQRSLKTRAAFIPARPLNIDSKGDWLRIPIKLTMHSINN